MRTRARRAGRLLLVLLGMYVLSYVVYRQVRLERWERDGRLYVIYPYATLLPYAFFRPLALIDERLTGTGSHIGPHR